MQAPAFLLLRSLLALAGELLRPEWSDALLLAGPAALASLYLLLQAIWRRRSSPARAESWVVVDGSIVMHWRDETANLDTLREVIGELKQRGLSPGVVFDANAGYKLVGRYRHDGAMGKLLGLPEAMIMVVPKGTVADGVVLQAARNLGARIVSNDRFRDWAEQHPEVAEPGRLIRGGYREGRLWLET